jgi:hypothetical protein
MLDAKDRGCTRPGCNAPGYKCEVHHIQERASTHCTDVNTLALDSRRHGVSAFSRVGVTRRFDEFRGTPRR